MKINQHIEYIANQKEDYLSIYLSSLEDNDASESKIQNLEKSHRSAQEENE